MNYSSKSDTFYSHYLLHIPLKFSNLGYPSPLPLEDMKYKQIGYLIGLVKFSLSIYIPILSRDGRKEKENIFLETKITISIMAGFTRVKTSDWILRHSTDLSDRTVVLYSLSSSRGLRSSSLELPLCILSLRLLFLDCVICLARPRACSNVMEETPLHPQF